MCRVTQGQLVLSLDQPYWSRVLPPWSLEHRGRPRRSTPTARCESLWTIGSRGAILSRENVDAGRVHLTYWTICPKAWLDPARPMPGYEAWCGGLCIT
jgi:hypothetical protein